VSSFSTFEKGQSSLPVEKLGVYSEDKQNQCRLSFFSCHGRCGYRGGYCEMVGFDSDVMRMLAKMTSARLCSNTSGQLVMECVVNPPQPGEPSYSQFEEVMSILYCRTAYQLHFQKHVYHISLHSLGG